MKIARQPTKVLAGVDNLDADRLVIGQPAHIRRVFQVRENANAVMNTGSTADFRQDDRVLST